MSPTVFRKKGYRFYFFSKEESRMHVHVEDADGEAKFWIEPVVALAEYHGLSKKQITEVQKLIEESTNEITKAWKLHFKLKG